MITPTQFAMLWAKAHDKMKESLGAAHHTEAWVPLDNQDSFPMFGWMHNGAYFRFHIRSIDPATGRAKDQDIEHASLFVQSKAALQIEKLRVAVIEAHGRDLSLLKKASAAMTKFLND